MNIKISEPNEAPLPLVYTKQKKRVMFDMTPKQAPSDETTTNPNHIDLQVENLEESDYENFKKPTSFQD